MYGMCAAFQFEYWFSLFYKLCGNNRTPGLFGTFEAVHQVGTICLTRDNIVPDNLYDS